MISLLTSRFLLLISHFSFLKTLILLLSRLRQAPLPCRDKGNRFCQKPPSLCPLKRLFLRRDPRLFSPLSHCLYVPFRLSSPYRELKRPQGYCRESRL